MQVKNKEELIEASKTFIIKNWILFLIIFLIFEFRQGTILREQNNKIDEVFKYVRENLNNVVAVTDSGLLVDVEKVKIDAETLNTILENTLKKLIVPRSELTQGFDVSNFKNSVDILKVSENLQYFFEHVVVQNEELAKRIPFMVKNKDKEYNTNAYELGIKGKRYFQAYLEKLRQTILENTLPHFINIYKTETRKYESDENVFFIIVDYYITMQQWKGTDKKGNDLYNTFRTKFSVAAKGYFDIRLRTRKDGDIKGINNLGLHFFELKIDTPREFDINQKVIK